MRFNYFLIRALFCVISVSGVAHAAESIAIVGKNDWLFIRYEMVLESLAKDAEVSLGLIDKINRMLQKNNVILVVAMIPSKMETYAEQLPDDVKVSEYMTTFNDRALNTLREHGVHVIDIKKSMRDAALMDTQNPLFFRLDTHWTHSGAWVAAKAIGNGLVASPGLKSVLQQTNPEEYKLTWATHNLRQRKIRDITNFLPPGSPVFPPEETRRFTVVRQNQSMDTPLVGQQQRSPEIALVGSSYSGDWTGFPDALRFVLQRNVFNFSVNADAGPWAVMRAFLRDDVYQMHKPKLIVWEIPERAIGLGPSYRFRLPRYQVSNEEWLLQVAALLEPACDPLPIQVRLDTAGLKNLTANVAGATLPQAMRFVEITFDSAVNSTGYLSAKLTSDGAKQITVETWNQLVLERKFMLDVAGDDQAHLMKTPISMGKQGVTKLKIFPGNASSFSIRDVQLCRHQADWLRD